MMPAKQLPRAIAFSPRFVDPLSGSIFIVIKGQDSTGPAQSPTTVQTLDPAAIEKSLFPASCWDTVAGLHLAKLFCSFGWQSSLNASVLPPGEAFNPPRLRTKFYLDV